MHERRRLRVDAQAAEVGVHDEVDDAGDRVGAVHRRRAAGQHVDALDQRGRDEVDVGDRALRGSPGCRRRPLISTRVRSEPRPRRLTVGGAGRAVGDVRTLRRERLRQRVDQILGAGRALKLDVLARQHRHRAGRGQVRLRNARAGDDDVARGLDRSRRARTSTEAREPSTGAVGRLICGRTSAGFGGGVASVLRKRRRGEPCWHQPGAWSRAGADGNRASFNSSPSLADARARLPWIGKRNFAELHLVIGEARERLATAARPHRASCQSAVSILQQRPLVLFASVGLGFERTHGGQRTCGILS